MEGRNAHVLISPIKKDKPADKGKPPAPKPPVKS
jgi:hypothetical protein